MPADSIKHPSMYPIWMRQAMERAMDHDKGGPVYAATVKDDAQERSMRRAFRACVKANRAVAVPDWRASQREMFLDTTFRVWRHEHYLYVQATRGRLQALAERDEIDAELRACMTDPPVNPPWQGK